MTFGPPSLRWNASRRHSRDSVGRRRVGTPLALMLLAFMSCSSPAAPPGRSIAIVRLTIGDQTVLIDWDDGPRSAATIPPNGSAATQFTIATFHRSNGTPIPLDPSEYEIRLEPEDTERVEFVRTEPFSGILRRLTPGLAEIEVSVVHIPTGNTEFGPHNLIVN